MRRFKIIFLVTISLSVGLALFVACGGGGGGGGGSDTFLLFSGNNGADGYELWYTDGTAAGTTMIADINPSVTTTNSSYPWRFGSLGGVVYFQADDGTRGMELWSSDGTAAGTTLVKDIRSGLDGSRPSYMTPLGGTLYFSAYSDSVRGTELWSSDGTAGGTTLVVDIFPGGSPSPNSSNPYWLTVFKNGIYFAAYDALRGTELWSSNGTAAGTTLVKDINPGSAGSQPSYMATLDGTLYFSAYSDSVRGYELWSSDGTAPSTTLVVDIFPGGSPSPNSSYPYWLTVFKGRIYFTALDALRGNELWATDGTAGGTTFIVDINNSGSSNPRYLTVLDNRLYFSADDGVRGNELWSTDGTAAGTTIVKDIETGSGSSWMYPLGILNGKLLFAPIDSTHGRELWSTDGTPAGTDMIKDIDPGTGDGVYSPAPK